MSKVANKVVDVAIVGAGTAGCLLANRLSASGKLRVLLVEAGSNDRWDPVVRVPAGYLKAMGSKRHDWCFKTSPQAGLSNRALGYPRGKVLGGCSSINGMVYMRGQSQDYDTWEKMLMTDDSAAVHWGWHHVLPYFKKHEDFGVLPADQVDRDFHGIGGELRVERLRCHFDLLDRIAEAAVEMNIPAIDDFNTGNNFGVSPFHVTQRSGQRWNSSRAFLSDEVLNRPNLEVWTDTDVLRLGTEAFSPSKASLLPDRVSSRTGNAHTRVRGLEVLDRRKSSPEQVTVDAGTVVLCAGAIGTPHLMQVSGLGPGEKLSQHGVKVVHDMPGVGQNLHDHLQLRPIFKVTGLPTLNSLSKSLTGKLSIGLQYLTSQSGPLSSAPSQVGIFAKTDESLEFPDIQYHLQPLSLDRFGTPLHSFDAFTASVTTLQPLSRGSVALSSASVLTPPTIDPAYLISETDRLVAFKSIEHARRLASQPALSGIVTGEYLPGPQKRSMEEVVEAAAQSASPIFHPVGTCKMSHAGDASGVVDAKLRCHDVQGLWISDASIMPRITSGNTNAPCLMIAERASEWILDELE